MKLKRERAAPHPRDKEDCKDIPSEKTLRATRAKNAVNSKSNDRLNAYQFFGWPWMNYLKILSDIPPELSAPFNGISLRMSTSIDRCQTK